MNMTKRSPPFWIFGKVGSPPDGTWDTHKLKILMVIFHFGFRIFVDVKFSHLEQIFWLAHQIFLRAALANHQQGAERG